ncbi:MULTISPECIES: type VI secretion system protein TssA [unclassified Pseudomonas]|uniref:type VI secretion system protein TssA n=1 Tax=unclassified Pseudomonas TaxID=196821 RepID=UPI0024498D55|nr:MULTISPECIES: type VI secretion system protein TssA [unclassified Pseudomonas]MDG9926939.1 type VI secretion system protein TssA [Pseudomonas sp. GD04042]MDH0484582.1 type VI secretion system protein TssA [Pseudomonas sp. GD04015]MDH0602354.1 type VI secretion system protein TssA [Pseudomonas sp. GD03869]
MNLDIDALLAPVATDQPGGRPLDYDNDFLELEREMQGTPEQQYGDTLIPAQEPDWSTVLQAARSQLSRSKDFRLAVAITRALTRLHGPRGTAEGLALVIEMTRRYWQDGHPVLHEDGEEDLLPRGNALAGLAAAGGLPSDLRCAEIGSRQLGKLALGTLERIALSREDVSGEPLQRDQLPRFLRDELESGNQDLLALPCIRERVQELRGLLSPALGTEHAPDFASILGLTELLAPSSASTAEQASDESSEPATTDAPAAPRLGPAGATSRSDAIAMLDAVCEFLERNEPANPAPLLIRRARNMIGQDFLAILRDLAPAGLQQAELIAGLSRQD